jgi:hypothetical protein
MYLANYKMVIIDGHGVHMFNKLARSYAPRYDAPHAHMIVISILQNQYLYFLAHTLVPYEHVVPHEIIEKFAVK